MIPLYLAILSSSSGDHGDINTGSVQEAQEEQLQLQLQQQVDPVVPLNQLEQILDSIMVAATKSPVITMLLCTLLSLLLCLGVANSFFASRAEALRVGFHRCIMRPVMSPFQRLLSQEEPEHIATKGESTGSTSQSESSSAMRTLKNLASFDMWSDLSHPFGAASEGHDLTAHLESPDVTHFCFLLHGHRGLAKDLEYMQVMMQQIAVEEKQKQKQKQTNDQNDETTKVEGHNDATPIHDMVVHNSVCNQGKTTDGIRNGGDRLVQEMRQVIKNEMIKRHSELEFLKTDDEEGDNEDLSLLASDDNNSSLQDSTSNTPELYNVTVSILGNSLGGLFGRYAIAKLIEEYCVLEESESSDCWILDGRFRLRLNIFCTTATPHLGVSRHTYVKIPRTAEIGVAHALGNTGKDLFRLNDLLHSMATTPTFLNPLSKFRKRIAYANAYGTDFPVPASTAAFLSENSTYPHYILETNTSSTSTATSEDGTSTTVTETHGGMVIATLYTPTQHNGDNVSDEDNDDDNHSSESSPSLESPKSGDQEDELDQMSRSLDRLGWKKVFVDIRRELPGAALPKTSWLRLSKADPSSHQEEGSAPIPNLQSLQLEHRAVESREVATAVSSPIDNRFALPLGHNMIVAFSRSRLTAFMNKGGRPVVDSLAKELVEEIFAWDGQKPAASELSQTPRVALVPNNTSSSRKSTNITASSAN